MQIFNGLYEIQIYNKMNTIVLNSESNILNEIKKIKIPNSIERFQIDTLVTNIEKKLSSSHNVYSIKNIITNFRDLAIVLKYNNLQVKNYCKCEEKYPLFHLCDEFSLVFKNNIEIFGTRIINIYSVTCVD